MPPPDDPKGLLDNDLRDYNTRYRTFVDEADEIHRLCREWYAQHRTDKGEPGEAARTDEHHGYYRMIDEYPTWHTARRAWQEAWPLASSGGSGEGGGGGNTGNVSRLRAQGHYFMQEDGSRFTAICITSFVLQKFVCEGTDTEPWLSQVRDMGFNMVRDFVAQEWGDPAYDVLPTTHRDYYQHLGETAQRCADHGLYYMACLFAGWQPPQNEQLDHFNRCIEVLRPFSNVLIELVNENDASGHLDTSIFPRPSGVLASHGSNGSQTCPPRPWWDWEAFHTNAAPEEQRKVGHNAMELSEGTQDWPPSHVPVITNEVSRYPQVGMWIGSPLDEQKRLAYESAAGAALLIAGSDYHSVDAKLCRRLNAEEEQVARAWVDGARSVPLEFQDGHYRRHDEKVDPDSPQYDPTMLRVYGRQLGDGREHVVEIHKDMNAIPAPKGQSAPEAEQQQRDDYFREELKKEQERDAWREQQRQGVAPKGKQGKR